MPARATVYFLHRDSQRWVTPARCPPSSTSTSQRDRGNLTCVTYSWRRGADSREYPVEKSTHVPHDLSVRIPIRGCRSVLCAKALSSAIPRRGGSNPAKRWLQQPEDMTRRIKRQNRKNTGPKMALFGNENASTLVVRIERDVFINSFRSLSHHLPMPRLYLLGLFYRPRKTRRLFPTRSLKTPDCSSQPTWAAVPSVVYIIDAVSNDPQLPPILDGGGVIHSPPPFFWYCC